MPCNHQLTATTLLQLGVDGYACVYTHHYSTSTLGVDSHVPCTHNILSLLAHHRAPQVHHQPPSSLQGLMQGSGRIFSA
jgi:hypothetical protein